MDEMTIALVIAAIAVIAIALIVMRWRSASGEQHALRHYQNALDTLRTVSDRMESSRPVIEAKGQPRSEDVEVGPDRAAAAGRHGAPDRQGASGRQGASARSPSGTVAWSTASDSQQSRVTAQPPKQAPQERSGAPGAAARQGSLARQITAARELQASRQAHVADAPVDDDLAPHSSGPDRPPDVSKGTNGHSSQSVLVFDEQTPEFGTSKISPAGAFEGPIVTRAGRRALQRSSRPQSRMLMVIGVCFVVLVIAGVAALVSSLGKHHTTSPPAGSHHNSAVHHAKTTTTSSSTTTTAPASVLPEASTATVAGATYAAPAGRYTVTLTSSGACWVYATLASTHAVIWTGTLDQGQAQQLSGTGEIDVELGHANTMTETLNSVPVQYPAQYQAVFTMKFVPSTA